MNFLLMKNTLFLLLAKVLKVDLFAWQVSIHLPLSCCLKLMINQVCLGLDMLEPKVPEHLVWSIGDQVYHLLERI